MCEVRTLREWRKERLYGLAYLSERAQVTKQTIIAVERGRSLPRYGTMRKLSEALGVEARQIAEFAAALDRASDA